MKRFVAVALVAALVGLSCAGTDRDRDGVPTRPNPTLKTATFAVGPATITAELALTADQREKGLMFRKSLAEGRGMLFVFQNDEVLNFWMKNTLIPLSIAWIGSDGIIKGISDMRALDLNAVGSERSVRYALEAPLGWFARAGVKAGDRVALPPLRAEN